jgi:hypothetical protein
VLEGLANTKSTTLKGKPFDQTPAKIAKLMDSLKKADNICPPL